MNHDRSLNTNDIVGAQPKAFGRNPVSQSQVFNNSNSNYSQKSGQLRNPLYFDVSQSQVVSPNRSQQQRSNKPQDSIDQLLRQSGTTQNLNSNKIQIQQQQQQQQQQSNYQQNLDNFYKGMTPNIQSRQQYKDQKQLIESKSQEKKPVENVQSQDYQKNADNFYKGMTPNVQSREQYQAQKQVIENKTREREINKMQENLNQQKQQISNLQMQKQQYKQQQQQKQQDQPQQQSNRSYTSLDPINNKINIDLQQQAQQQQQQQLSNGSKVLNQNAIINSQPFYTQMRYEKVFVICDSDSRIVEQVTKMLYSRSITDFEIFNVLGSTIKLNTSLKQLDALKEAIDFANQVYKITQFYIFNSGNSPAVKHILNKDMDRGTLRITNIEALKKFRSQFLDKYYKEFPTKIFYLDVRGNPEQIS